MKLTKLKILICVLICFLLIGVPLITSYAYDGTLDTKEVKELRVASINCYYREDPPPHGDITLEVKKGDIIYVIGEMIVSANEHFPIEYLLCNTEEGKKWIWKGFTKQKNNKHASSSNHESSKPNTSPNTSAPDKEGMTYVGTFKCTTYCPCKTCNGGWNTTATGNPLTPWYTIAVDPRVIPLGSTVYIEGLGTFKAHDTGGAIKGNKIDVCVDSHSYAQTQTWYNMQVYIVH